MRKAKRLIGLILSVVITAYLFVHVSYMYRGYYRLMSFYGIEDNTLDVVLVGTSITFSSFMPMEAWEQYGMAACDYCTNVHFENSLRYSVREVMKTQNPKLIMIDIAPFYRDHYGGTKEWDDDFRKLCIKYNLDSMKYSFDRALLAKEITRDSGGNLYDYLYYFFDITRYHTNTPSRQQYDNALHDAGRGYEHLKRSSNSVDEASLLEDDGSEMPLEEHQQEYLRLLIDEVDKLDCDVVFFCSPVLFNDSTCLMRKNYIGRIVSEAGYPFWDLSKDVGELGLDYNTDFWSLDHYDCLGAEKVTPYIAQKIKENYEIPDRRKDPAYSNWHDDYQEWINIKEKYRDKDFGFYDAQDCNELFNIIKEIKYDAVVEILNPEILSLMDNEILQSIGISEDKITEKTNLLFIHNGTESTVLNDFRFSGDVSDTVLGEASVFCNESGKYGIYLNEEECIVSSPEEPDADIRIRVFRDGDLKQTICDASFEVGLEGSPLGIFEYYRIK